MQLRIYGDQLLCTVDVSIGVKLEDATVDSMEAGEELDCGISMEERTEGHKFYVNPFRWDAAAQYVHNTVRPKMVRMQSSDVM